MLTHHTIQNAVVDIPQRANRSSSATFNASWHCTRVSSKTTRLNVLRSSPCAANARRNGQSLASASAGIVPRFANRRPRPAPSFVDKSLMCRERHWEAFLVCCIADGRKAKQMRKLEAIEDTLPQAFLPRILAFVGPKSTCYCALPAHGTARCLLASIPLRELRQKFASTG